MKLASPIMISIPAAGTPFVQFDPVVHVLVNPIQLVVCASVFIDSNTRKLNMKKQESFRLSKCLII